MAVEIDLPQHEAEWKRILKNPIKFTAKSVNKGAEVSWTKLGEAQCRAMESAKQLDVSTLFKEAVRERYRGVIPAGRLIRMRWVLTTNGLDHQPQKGKCKARLVLLGYSDPDLLELPTAGPTMTRRPVR